MTDAMGELKAAADEGKRRRGQARLTVTVLFLVALLQIASTLTLGGFVMSWRHQDKTQSQRQSADATLRAKRTEDLYAKENDTNNVVRALAGQPQAPPIVPPPVATSTTTTTTVRRSAPPTSESPGRSPSTTGAQPSPPPTAPPAQPQPPPTTPPTTQPCLAVVLGRCVP